MNEVRTKAVKIFTDARSTVTSTDRGLMLLLSPALAFILFGLAAIFAPGLILFLIAAFCIFFGTLFAFMAFKFWQLKSRFEKMAKDYQGQVIVQGFNINDLKDFETQVHFEDEEEDDEDDLTFH